MITAEIFKPLKGTQPDYDQTNGLIREFAKIKDSRDPLLLTFDEVEKILIWQASGSSNWRNKWRWLQNTDEDVRQATEFAFSISLRDKNIETKFRIKALRTLYGIGIVSASAILTIVYPTRYAVLNEGNWNLVFSDEEKSNLTVQDYIKYLAFVQELAGELNWTPQEVDHAIWEYIRRQSE